MSQNFSHNPEYSRDREFKVILEDLQGQFRVFGEGQQMLTRKVDGLSERADRLDHRMDNFEVVLLANRTDVASIKQNLDRFFNILNDHEKRIIALEPAGGRR